MGKETTSMYGQIPSDEPPSYNEIVNPIPLPTAPSAPEGYNPQHRPQMEIAPQQQPPIILVQTIHPLGPKPCLLICPSCQQQQLTKVRSESSMKTHFFAIMLCILGFCCCAFLPYCMNTCQNTNHYCSNCNAYIGLYDK